MEQYMPFIIYALPVLFGVIMAKRYNFILGFVSVFFFAYLLHFITDVGGDSIGDFIASVPGLAEGLTTITAIYVQQFFIYIEEIMGSFGMDGTFAQLTGNRWLFFGVYTGGYFVLGLISTFFRARRKKELRRLRRENRRY